MDLIDDDSTHSFQQNHIYTEASSYRTVRQEIKTAVLVTTCVPLISTYHGFTTGQKFVCLR